MRQEMVTLEARGIAVTVNPRLGMIEEVKVSRDGRTVAPLHKAPWRNEANALPKDAAPHLAPKPHTCTAVDFAAKCRELALRRWYSSESGQLGRRRRRG